MSYLLLANNLLELDPLELDDEDHVCLKLDHLFDLTSSVNTRKLLSILDICICEKAKGSYSYEQKEYLLKPTS